MKLKLIDIWMFREDSRCWEVWSVRFGDEYFDIYQFMSASKIRTHMQSWVYEVYKPRDYVGNLDASFGGRFSSMRAFMELERTLGVKG